VIYILHFSRPLFHAQHYIGYTGAADMEERMQRHRSGRGAKIMKAVFEAGIDVEIAAILPGDRTEERRLHRQGNTKRICPLCRFLAKEKEELNTLRGGLS